MHKVVKTVTYSRIMGFGAIVALLMVFDFDVRPERQIALTSKLKTMG